MLLRIGTLPATGAERAELLRERTFLTTVDPELMIPPPSRPPPGARLLALLDRAERGAGSGLDVFVAFPRRVGRAAALEAATTLRATYLMAYHDQ